VVALEPSTCFSDQNNKSGTRSVRYQPDIVGDPKSDTAKEHSVPESSINASWAPWTRKLVGRAPERGVSFAVSIALLGKPWR
jgi:hypothetical protein